MICHLLNYMTSDGAEKPTLPQPHWPTYCNVSCDGNDQPHLKDLFSIGITALGPRKRIFHALSELRKGSTKSPEIRIDSTKDTIDETGRLAANKLITDYFPGPAGHRKKDCTSSSGQPGAEKGHSDARRKQIVVKKNVKSKTLRDIPQWCNVPGTPFRVVNGL
ncbi:hypothetical protein U1Q18_002976 [Sarracenia purpurea var. burkii]